MKQHTLQCERVTHPNSLHPCDCKGVKAVKESSQKRNRKCRRCTSTVYGDAARMKQHEAEHKVVERALAAGLVVPKSSKVTGVLV